MIAALRLLRQLRPAATAALTMLSAALVLAGTSRYAAQTAMDARELAQRARDRAANELREAHAAATAAFAGSELLRQLEDDGAFAGDQPEQRLAQLRTSQLALRLPGMRPSFGASAPWPGGDAGRYFWNSTPLHLELELLHEGDLPDFLARITRGTPLLVRECRLFRTLDDNASSPGLHADCELLWLHLQAREGK